MRTLSKIERQILLKKYIKSGLDFKDALIKLNKFHDYLKDLNKQLKLKGKSNEDIDEIFKQKFYTLCSKLDT